MPRKPHLLAARPASLAVGLAAAVLVLAGLACSTLLPPRPPVAWDSDPANLVAQVDVCCGMMYDPNGVPNARLWGDGRLVWVQWDSTYTRRDVLEATLTPSEMEALLQDFVDAGFFGWRHFYQDGIVYDAPSHCVSVTLIEARHSVCEVLSAGPAALDRLSTRLSTGAGHTGTPLAPTRGHLTAMPGSMPSGPVPLWPAEAAGLSLANATGGIWIEGEALQQAWALVNAHPLNAIVEDGGSAYLLVLLVPGVTRDQPE